MDSREFVARFEAERQALAVMDHPGIARAFDPPLIAAADAREKRCGVGHANAKATHAEVAKLYDAWGKPEKAAVWRQRASGK